MLDKSKRLNIKTSFKWVADGSHRDLPTVKIFWRFSPTNTHALVNVAVKSKDFKQATLRNKAKRRCLKAVFNLYPLLRSDLNLVMIPKVQILDQEVVEIENQLKNVKEIFSRNN